MHSLLLLSASSAHNTLLLLSLLGTYLKFSKTSNYWSQNSAKIAKSVNKSLTSSPVFNPLDILLLYAKDDVIYKSTIERLDQGHLYPLGERRDEHVTGGARTSAPLQSRRTLYLKSYLDSL